MQTETVARTWQERVLCVFLRWVAGVSLLALAAVFMPYSWMNTIHQALGMGILPAVPIVGYLARSLSLFYALMAGLLILCSLDTARYRAVLHYLGGAFVVFGLVMMGIDYAEGMPVLWKQLEGPYVTAFGILILVLLPRIKHRDPKTPH